MEHWHNRGELSAVISVKRGLRFLVVVLFLLPFVWMVSAAVYRTGTPLPTSLQLVPQSPTLENFGRIFTISPFGRFTLNSLRVTLIAVPLTLITASWAGFAIAQLPQRSQRRFVIFSLALLMVPGIALWSTRFLIYKQLGWLDSMWALIAPAWMGSSPFFVLMFYRAFRRIPSGIYDAARLDGVEAFGLWRQIALPIARPTTIGVALLSFVLYWGDFVSPLLYLSRETNYTLPVALQSLQQMNRSDWPLLMAGAVWATLIPVALVIITAILLNRRR